MKIRNVLFLLAAICLMLFLGYMDVNAVTGPTISPDTIPPATVGVHYEQQFTASGGVEPYIWSSNNGDLSGVCGIVGNTGLFTCYESLLTGTYVGSHTITIIVDEGGGSTGSREYTLTVYPPLTLSPDALSPGKINEAYDQAISVSGGVGPYSIALAPGSEPLPDGLSLTSSGISGTPSVNGGFAFKIKAEDSNGALGINNYTLWISPLQSFTWSPDPPLDNSMTAFTAIPESTSYLWTRGYDPGDTCDQDPYTFGINRYSETRFGASGDYQVCLKYFVGAPTGYALDSAWVTVDNTAPNFYMDVPERDLVGREIYTYASIGGVYDGPYTCSMNWGDGSPTAQVTAGTDETWCSFPPHAYAAGGTFTVEMSVTDAEAATKTQTSPIELVYVIAEPGSDALASNVDPTIVPIISLASPGTTSLTFAISSDPLHGSLGTPTFVKCEPMDEQGPLGAPAGDTSSKAPQRAYLADRKIPTTYAQVDSHAATAAQAGGPVVCMGTVVYTPNPTDPLYVGQDVFSFTASDGPHTSTPEDVYLWVDANSPPTAQAGSVAVRASGSSYVMLTATDPDFHDYMGDWMNFAIASPPTNGTLGALSEPFCDDWYNEESRLGQICRSAVVYTPNPGTHARSDSFTFLVNDSHNDSSPATVSLDLHTGATLHVNAADDDIGDGVCDNSHCNLREAVDNALVGDIIDFTLSLPNTIVLSQGQILIDKDINISGPGADQLAISGGAPPEAGPYQGYPRVFEFYDGDSYGLLPLNATISGLTIRDGRAGVGGGFIMGPNSTVTLNDCVIGPNNVVGEAGGGFANEGGILTLNRCSVIGNSGTGTVGGAGIFTAYGGSTTLINSTVSGNVTNNDGGGIHVGEGGEISLIHSTVSGNLANQNYLVEAYGGGGGIYIKKYGRATLLNSLVAGNTDLSDPETANHAKWPDIYGAFTSSGGNLIGDPTGSTGWIEGDQVGTAADPIDALLDVLAVNEPGHTPTYALLEGSPAINAAPTCEAGTDQRGVTRPQGSTCDIGAFEVAVLPMLHVENMTFNAKIGRTTHTLTGLITIQNYSDNTPLSRVVVTAKLSQWIEGAWQIVEVRTSPISNTNRLGEAKFVWRGMPAGQYKLEVDNAAKDGYLYDDSLNHVVERVITIP